METKRISVLFETEGTYPFKGGGVSVWSDILCRELKDIDFYILAITGNPIVSLQYELPTNIKKIILIPLWGSEEPINHFNSDNQPKDLLIRKRRTSLSVIKEKFIPLFKELLNKINKDDSYDLKTAILIYNLYCYFQIYDYKTTFRSEIVWKIFKEEMTIFFNNKHDKNYELPSLHDFTYSLRMLYHYLIPLSVGIPETDITHTSIAGFCGLASIISKIKYGTPMIVTDHGVFMRERYIAVSTSDFNYFSKKFLINLSTFISKLCYLFADQISPVCNFNKKWEILLGAQPEKIYTIYNGINPDLFRPKNKPSKTTKIPTVIAVSHIMPLKDIKSMIYSCYLVRKKIPNVKYIVYGSMDVDIPYTRECQKLIKRLKLEKNFSLAGFHADKSQLYNTGDIGILTSISEGFPYTILESMSCARPVVATDVGGVKEAINGYGILVKPLDIKAISEGVITLLNDNKLRLEMGKLARERILINFRISSTINAYLETYTRLKETKKIISKNTQNIQKKLVEDVGICWYMDFRIKNNN